MATFKISQMCAAKKSALFSIGHIFIIEHVGDYLTKQKIPE